MGLRLPNLNVDSGEFGRPQTPIVELDIARRANAWMLACVAACPSVDCQEITSIIDITSDWLFHADRTLRGC